MRIIRMAAVWRQGRVGRRSDMNDLSLPLGSVVRFGKFELNPRSGELRNGSSSVTLPEQPLRLLLALLERPGDLVTRDELRRRLWPEDVYVDVEHGLNAAVKRLRTALGDSAEQPQVVETVPRRGYRLVAPPTPAHDPAPDDVLKDRPAPPGRAAPAGRWNTAVIMAALVAVAATGAWYVSRRSPGAGPAASSRDLTRLTFGSGLQKDVAWSPDGQRIAYASDQAGNFDIWVQSVSGGEATAITSSPAPDTQPAWSPDGRQLAFRSERDGGGLWVVPALGGPARRLTSFGESPTWLPEGREIFFLAGLTLDSVTDLYVVPAGGDSPAREILTEFLAGGRWEWAALHPDGRITVIGAHRSHGFGVFTLDSTGRDLVSVKPPASLLKLLGWHDPKITRRFHWGPSGAALFFEVTSIGVPSLWKVSVAPATLEWLSAERLTTGPGSAAASAVSPDGNRLAFTSQRGNPRAWVFPFDETTGRLEAGGRPVTDDDTGISSLAIMPGGRSIVYNGTRAGTDHVGVLATDLETGATTVLSPDARGPVASRDGRQISYLLRRMPSGAARNGQLESLNEFALAVRDRAGAERLVSGWTTRAVMLASDWTLDGKAILGSYWEPVGTGPVVLALWPAGRGIAERPDRIVLQSPGARIWQGRFSPDGRWISFVVERRDSPGHLELGVVAATAAGQGGWTRIAADHEWPDKPRWAPDGKTLYFVSSKPAGYLNLWGVRVDPLHAKPHGEPFQITHFDSPSLMIDPDLSGTSEIDIAAGRLALTMRSVSGSIWMLSGVDR